MRLAFFVSPHGFGHAARSAAVMDALWRRQQCIRYEIFTTVPRWFFEASLACPWERHAVECDIGLVQRSALEEDVFATYDRLQRWVPFPPGEVRRLAQSIHDLQCDGVVCDISPLGLAVAKEAGLPSILIENFTWDWVYRSYTRICPKLAEIADTFEELFRGADLRIQTVPHCERDRSAHEVAPVSRRSHVCAAETRGNLGIDGHDRVVLVSMGGVPWDFTGLERVAAAQGVTVVVPGGSASERRFGSVITVPHHSRFYHPDLVHAADGLVGKVGYSTIAEAWAAGLGMGWIRRPAFPESDVLARWVGRNVGGAEISVAELEDGAWADRIPQVLACRADATDRVNGADQAAELILDFMSWS